MELVCTALTGRHAFAAAACLFALGAGLAGCRHVSPGPGKATDTSRIVIETSEKTRRAAAAIGGEAAARPNVRMVSGATESEVGIAFYPGARLTSSQLVRVGTDLTAGAELITQDAYQDVLDFYRDRYASPELKVVEQDAASGRFTLLNWRDPQGNYTVGLRRDDQRKQTTITLARVKSGKKRRPAAP